MILYYLIYPFAWLVGKSPLRVQFALSSVIRWFIYNIFGYRLRVVRENLLNSFPDYTPQQRKDIERKFYSHLADVFIESMVFASMSEQSMRSRMVFTNSAELEQQTLGRSFIAMMAHYGSWEFTSSYHLHTDHESVYGVYRPLANRGVDRYYLYCRSRFGSEPVPMNDIATRVFQKRHSEKGVVVALIADQAPPRYDDVDWLMFLNQPTQFFIGGEKMARLMHLPVYFTHVEQVKRGFYTNTFELIYDGREQIEDFEILRRYSQRLEAMIIKRPELWMWSHRRWKRKPLEPIEIKRVQPTQKDG